MRMLLTPLLIHIRNKEDVMKFNYILYIPLILLFFPAFAFYMPGLNGVYLVFFIFTYMTLILLIIKENKNIIFKIVDIIKKTPLHIFITLLGLMVINSLYLSFIGITTLSLTIRSTILQIFMYILPTFIIFLYLIDSYINYKTVIKFFYTAFWVYLILGILSYLGMLFKIEFINCVFDFLSNARKINFEKTLKYSLMITSNYTSFGLPRLDCLAVEPSAHACFIYLYLPLIYKLTNLKIRMYNSLKMEIVIKKTMIALVWINIILTQSPIYLILSLIITLLTFIKQIFKYIKKYFVIIILIIFLLIALFIHVLSNITLSNTYLSRIANTFVSIGSIDTFIYLEPSLATRIISFYNQFLLFLKYPFTGVGLGNVGYKMIEQYINSPLPLTGEMITKLQLALTGKSKLLINQGLIYYFLAENGIVLGGMFLYFHFKLYKTMQILTKYVSNDSLLSITIEGLKKCWIGITIWLFYESSLLRLDYLFLYILIISLIYRIKTQYKKCLEEK